MTQALTVDITDDLEKILSFQYTEFDIQQQQVLDTAGEGCMFGIKDYLDDAVKKGSSTYCHMISRYLSYYILACLI